MRARRAAVSALAQKTLRQALLLLAALVLVATPCVAQCPAEEARAAVPQVPQVSQASTRALSVHTELPPMPSLATAGMAGPAGGRSLFANPAADEPARATPGFTLTQPDPYRPYQNGRPAAVLEPSDVSARLRARGFVDVSGVRQRGRTFLAEATGPRGERVRLVIDAASGEISGMQVIGFGPPH